MTRPMLTLLIVENSLADRELYRHCLQENSSCVYKFIEASSAIAGLELYRRQEVDAIILNYLLPDMKGIEFMKALQVQSNGNTPPVIIVSDEGASSNLLHNLSQAALQNAVQAIKLGASDYLLKHHLTPQVLQSAVQSAIKNSRSRVEIRQNDELFRVSVENMLDCFGIYSAIRDNLGQIVDFRFDYLNAAALESNQMTCADIGKSLCEVFSAHHKTDLFEEYCRVVETGEPLIKEDMIYSDVFGGSKQLTRAYDIRASKLGDGFVVSWRDVTTRKQAELTQQEANRTMTTIWESMTDAYVTLDCEWRVTYTNQAATKVYFQLTGMEPEAFLGKSHWEIFPSLVGQPVEQEYRRAVTEQVAVHLEVFYEQTGNWFEAHAYPSVEGLGIYFRDITERKIAEETVRRQLGEIEAIYTAAPIGLCFIDTDLRFIRINSQLASINGLPVSEHVGRTLQEVLPEIVDDLEPLYHQVIASGRPILNLEVKGTTTAQPGVERHWLVSYYPQKDASGRVLGVNSMVQEITERKIAEANLEKATVLVEQQLAQIQAIYATAPVGLCYLDRERRFVQLNERLAEINGLSVAEHIGRTVQEILPELAKVQEPIFEQILQTGTPVLNVEVQGKTPAHPDIERYWLVSYYPLTSPNGHIEGINIMVQEITERKQAEKKLQESEERFQQLVRYVPHVLWISEPMQQRLLYASPAYEQIWGRPLAEFYADYNQWINAIHPDDIDRVKAHFKETILQCDYNTEYQVVRPDGSIRWIYDRGFPIVESSGEVRRVAGIAEDITERKQWEQEREHLLAEAEAANRSKDEFVAIVAHELRSPLNSVLGWAKLLRTRNLDAAATQKALLTIERNTQAQVQLVEDLLDISRMVRGTLHINLVPVNLVEVIEGALDSVRPMATAKQIQLETQFKKVLQTNGDFNRLQQIIINLLTNAIKFTPNQGKVNIALEQVESIVQIRITDTGKGIATEFLPSIFERFQQGQKNTGSSDGLGLGLAIVKNLVELHLGTITADSQGVGRGATFTIRLPLLENSTKESPDNGVLFDKASW
jgi:PAS domain S-box-containing protein